MKKTKYYFEVGEYYQESCDWGNICFAAAEKGILLYKEKSTGEIYSYEDISKHTLQTGGYVWTFNLLRTEEVEIVETVTKLPTENKYKNGYNWKAKGPNARLRKANSNADPYWKINKGKPPINPKTGRRDGGV